MSHFVRVRDIGVVAITGLLALSPANATEIDLQTLQLSDANLQHLWAFEGANDTTRLMDSKGSADLSRVAGEGNVNGVFGTVNDITFEQGFNGGQAYRPYYVDSSMSSTAGAGLTGGANAFTSPNMFTIEALVKADAKTSGSAVNYIFQTRPGSDRGYFLMQDEDNIGPTSTGGIGSIVGSSFSDTAIAGEYDSDGEWLYIAAVIDLVSNSGQAIGNLFFANLSDGDTTLTHAVNNKLWNTATPSTLAGNPAIFGIGGFAIDRNGDGFAEALQEFFQGAIDNVAIYDSTLSGSTLQSHLDALLVDQPVPEPASLALFGFGLAGVAAAARRRTRR